MMRVTPNGGQSLPSIELRQALKGHGFQPCRKGTKMDQALAAEGTQGLKPIERLSKCGAAGKPRPFKAAKKLIPDEPRLKNEL
jgi:hypothetical protein